MLSVLAEKQERITKLFITNKVNNWGIYGVRICKNGEWREVVVDDYFSKENQHSVKHMEMNCGFSCWRRHGLRYMAVMRE
mgnify:CR=1 FL=1